MATPQKLGTCAAMAAAVASYSGLSNRAYADDGTTPTGTGTGFRFPSSFSSPPPQPQNPPPPPPQEKPKPKPVDESNRRNGMDPTLLERGAKALRNINDNRYSKQVFDLMRMQEDTRQAELAVDQAMYQAHQAQQDIERQRKIAEQQLTMMDEQTQRKAQEARQKDELARRRMQTEHESKRSQNAEIVKMQEQASIRKEQARRRMEEQIQAQKRHSEKEKAEIERETARLEEWAKAEARAHLTKQTEEQNRRMLEDKSKGEIEKWVAAIKTSFEHIGDGAKDLLTDRRKLVMAVGGVTALAAGVYTTREGARVTWGYINRILGQPSLIRESSIAKYPFVGTISRGFSKVRNYGTGARTESKTSLENIVLKPSLHRRIEQLARATENTKIHEAPFRNMLFYGPPGTGKTMVAREIARKSGLDYAMMTGGDVAPLGAEAVTKIHQIFDWSKRSRKGLLLFIDEADAFLCERNSIYMSEAQRSALNALLYRTGDQSRDVVLVLATNRPADLDSAVTDRIDEVIEFPNPGEEERVKLIKLYLSKYLSDKDEPQSRWEMYKKKPQKITVKDLSEDAIREAAKKTEGFSGREIAKLMASVQAAVYGSPDCVLDTQLFKEIVDIKVTEHHQRIKLAVEGGV